MNLHSHSHEMEVDGIDTCIIDLSVLDDCLHSVRPLGDGAHGCQEVAVTGLPLNDVARCDVIVQAEILALEVHVRALEFRL